MQNTATHTDTHTIRHNGFDIREVKAMIGRVGVGLAGLLVAGLLLAGCGGKEPVSTTTLAGIQGTNTQAEQAGLTNRADILVAAERHTAELRAEQDARITNALLFVGVVLVATLGIIAGIWLLDKAGERAHERRLKRLAAETRLLEAERDTARLAVSEPQPSLSWQQRQVLELERRGRK